MSLNRKGESSAWSNFVFIIRETEINGIPPLMSRYLEIHRTQTFSRRAGKNVEETRNEMKTIEEIRYAFAFRSHFVVRVCVSNVFGFADVKN